MDDLVTKLIAYEQGELNDQETIALFQELIDTGTVWLLQGRHQRTAWTLISAGLCSENIATN